MARTKSLIRYPRTNTFTLLDIVELNEGISTQTVRKHVRTATDAGTLRVTGRKPSCGRGRPCFIYEKN